MPSRPARQVIERAVAVGALLVLTGAFDAWLHAWSAADAALPLARAIAIPFVLAALFWLARRPRRLERAVPVWPMLLVVVLAGASSVWSAAPLLTLRWTAGLAATTVIGIFLAVSFERDEQLRIVCTALGIAAIGSVALLMLSPWWGWGMHRPYWTGLFEDNNLFGRIMCLSMLAFVVLAIEQPPSRAFAAVRGGLSGVLLLGSGSRSAELVAGACTIAIGVALFLRRCGSAARRRVLVVAALATLLAVAVVGYGGGRLAALVGRDDTLSGRTVLWRATLQMGCERPWIGHGYGTFWLRAQAEPERLSTGATQVPVRHPHDGFLEIFYELGLIGLLGVLLPMAVLLRRAFVAGIVQRGSLWPLVYLLFLGLANVTESGLLRHKIFWALYVAVAVALPNTRRSPDVQCTS